MRAHINERQRQAALIFGHPLNVGRVSAQVSSEEVIKRVLGRAAERDEIAFAIDRDGNVYTERFWGDSALRTQH